MNKIVEIWTDGACKGNPGPGGWGALLRYQQHSKEIYGGEEMTTNNRMELLAVIRALEALKRPSEVVLYIDSQYVKNGMTQWLEGWLRNNWKTAAKKPVKNQDLWEKLHQISQAHQIKWVWVKGHADNAGNQRADELANLGVQAHSI